jgi:23S rRNA (adenine2503-C2)-methyltransferase
MQLLKLLLLQRLFLHRPVFTKTEMDKHKSLNNNHKKIATGNYTTLKILKRYKETNAIKYIFGLPDGNLIETVCIKRKTGITLCASTQVGCAVQCVFCASGKRGLIRNLTSWEIVQQFLLVKEPVNRIVFMGIGEPLHNYSQLMAAIHILRDRNGLNFPTDGITISTVAPLSKMKKLREEHIKVQLTVSLHATNQATRDELIPNMSNCDIKEIVRSIISYSERHDRKVTVAYLLLSGINDSNADVNQLVKWFSDKNVRINLLPYNQTTSRLKGVPKLRMAEFKKMLENAGLEVTIRESQGKRIQAACGQLASKNC